MAEEAKWYVVHTYSGYENKVADSIVNAVENRQLQHLITDVKIPTEMVVEIKDDGQKVEKEQKLFPSYVFVKMIMTDDSWYVVRNIRGVTGFVGVVDAIDTEKQLTRVTVSMMGKDVTVELALNEVKPLE